MAMRVAVSLTVSLLALSVLSAGSACGGVAEPNCLCGQTCPAETGRYVFASGNSTMTMVSGWTGLRRVYTIEGSFVLRVDTAARIAKFEQVDANLVDTVGVQPDHSLDDQFDLTGLAGTVLDDGSIQFEGKVDDAGSVSITLAFEAGSVHLTGKTTPPPDSADFPVFTLDALAGRKYAGGTGTADDPYQIATAADLISLGETLEDYDKHFILTADIDLDPNLPGRKVFDEPLIAGREFDWSEMDAMSYMFSGSFDGQGHRIINLTMERTSLLGLFGTIGLKGQVHNLGLVDVVLRFAAHSVGALVGDNYGTVTACYSTGSITSTDDGWNYGENIGGLVGWNAWGTVQNCWSSCSVEGGPGSYDVGGLVGDNDANVAASYSFGAVSAEHAGGLVGRNDGEIRDSFWDVETSGLTNSDGGEGRTTSQMQTMRTFLDAGWDFVGEAGNGMEDTWWIFDGRDYPRLSWERVLDDEFEDCRAEPLWMSYELEPELVQLLELDGRLEVEAVAQPEDVDAIYVANGWRLDATKDFALRVDFHFSKRGVGDGRVTLGVIPGLNPLAMQWAEFEAGCFDTDPFYLYEVRDGPWVQERVTTRSSDDGTLYMSYNPDTDELYFSRTGYGKANAWQTVLGLLKGRWATEAVYVILSGGSEGMALDPGDAWLDNLIINAGAIVRQE